ncbi:MAG: nucleotidyltransferase domain-containing protein [Dehalococcoidales bacterium]|nr:nucleotidyltransferase domain-containing protein [Dehalococcoidales bacterium]
MDLTSLIDSLKIMNPERIILFGSYAYGTPEVDSDVDLLVIMETLDPFHRRIQKLRPLLPRNKAVDLIVLTPEEYQQSKSTNPLVKEIAEKGKVVYG